MYLTNSAKFFNIFKLKSLTKEYKPRAYSRRFTVVNNYELPMPKYMHTNCLLFASCNKLLNNSTFYHLKSLIALPIRMIRILGVPLPPHTP